MIRREITFRARYDIVCTTIRDDVSKRTLESILENNYKKVSEICAAGKAN